MVLRLVKRRKLASMGGMGARGRRARYSSSRMRVSIRDRVQGSGLRE